VPPLAVNQGRINVLQRFANWQKVDFRHSGRPLFGLKKFCEPSEP